ncbi:histidinol-phosphate transaminase [Rhodohalobacter mucosus]|uniref:Histidinol-phosphate aminotransferase n=1 Tax=Rhodohalobacter mucosus TaxID=2079485 RepID=A0A316TKQ1_9BACT|nr:histidinol-phosphate transaminase [Rhodohalobacter mucosus]PWN05123.1 histidinol-phosphate transaminase [Rhodohalobacter mucosus]
MNISEIVPENIKKLKPYVAGKTIAEVRNEYHPDSISKLASNENRLGCSPAVKPAVIDALESIQDYPDPIAEKLRTAIAEQNHVKPEEILLAAGSESIISILCRTFFKNGDNAVTSNVTFVGFFVQTGVRGIELKKVPVTTGYGFDVDAMLNAIDSQTKMVYLANPNNPTGTILAAEEYRKLVDGIPDNVLLIADEAYYEYAKGYPDFLPAMEYRKENVVILRTFSKAYGLAGLRIGYAIAHPDVIREMIKAKLTFEPTAAAQAAALAAYGDFDFLRKSVELVEKGKEDLYGFFDMNDVEYVRSVSNSVMMILDSEREAVDFTQGMLKKGVILRRINAFGLPNCVRITIGRESEMDHFKNSFKKVYGPKKGSLLENEQKK